MEVDNMDAGKASSLTEEKITKLETHGFEWSLSP
jgi:hypothetical protein